MSPVAPAAFSVSTTARPAATGLMPPALVMNRVRPSTTYGSAARTYSGQVAGEAERLVALAVLLQDGERELGERLADEVVDAGVEHVGDRTVPVAVEPLPAPEADGHGAVVAARASGLHGQAELESNLRRRPVARPAPHPAAGRARGTASHSASAPCEVAVHAEAHEAEEEVRVGVRGVGGDRASDELLPSADERRAQPVWYSSHPR